MKTLTFVILSFVLSLNAAVANAERVNSKGSLRACQSQLLEHSDVETNYKFKRKVATSVDAERYEHWINVIEIGKESKTPLKVRCETTRSGEVTILEIKPGRWNI